MTTTRQHKTSSAAGQSRRRQEPANLQRHHGSSLDSLLKEDGVFEEAQAQAIKEVEAWHLTEASAKQRNPKGLPMRRGKS